MNTALPVTDARIEPHPTERIITAPRASGPSPRPTPHSTRAGRPIQHHNGLRAACQSYPAGPNRYKMTRTG
jgi:hypothetical protein